MVKRETNERRLNHFEGKIFRKKEHGPSTRNRTFKERQFSIPISCFKVRDFPWISFYALVIYCSCFRKKEYLKQLSSLFTATLTVSSLIKKKNHSTNALRRCSL